MTESESAQVQALEQHMERLAEMFSTTTAGRGEQCTSQAA